MVNWLKVRRWHFIGKILVYNLWYNTSDTTQKHFHQRNDPNLHLFFVLCKWSEWNKRKWKCFQLHNKSICAQVEGEHVGNEISGCTAVIEFWKEAKSHERASWSTKQNLNLIDLSLLKYCEKVFNPLELFLIKLLVQPGFKAKARQQKPVAPPEEFGQMFGHAELRKALIGFYSVGVSQFLPTSAWRLYKMIEWAQEIQFANKDLKATCKYKTFDGLQTQHQGCMLQVCSMLINQTYVHRVEPTYVLLHLDLLSDCRSRTFCVLLLLINHLVTAQTAVRFVRHSGWRVWKIASQPIEGGSVSDKICNSSILPVHAAIDRPSSFQHSVERRETDSVRCYPLL